MVEIADQDRKINNRIFDKLSQLDLQKMVEDRRLDFILVNNNTKS